MKNIVKILCGHCIALFLLVAAPVAQADAPKPTGDRLLQQELKQGQIKTTTARVGVQLDAVIDEYERNALAGDDVVVLKAIRSVLGSLTDKEMERVIGLLQQARVSNTAGSKSALDAFAGQKNITVQLRQLLLEYQRQQALHELSVRFAMLARRQGDNLKEGVALAGIAQIRDNGRLEDSHKISLQLQETEQDTISTEAKLALTKLESIVKQMDGLAAERPKAALKKSVDGQLQPTLATATTELRAAKILSAAGSEKRARDLMQDLSRLLAPNRDSLEVLKQALRDVEKAIADQQLVKDETKKLEGKNADTAEVEKRQAEVVDKTDTIRADVQGVSPKAADELKASTEKMQDARATLADNAKNTDIKKEVAPQKQDEAIAKLETAKEILKDQIAKAEAKAEKPKDKLAEVKELQKKVQELIKQEEKVKVAAEKAETKPEQLKTEAAKQAEVKEETKNVQQDAAQPAPEAAQALGEAAKQMKKSEEALANQENAPAAQQAALDALNKAEQQLGQKVAQLEKAKEDKAKLEALNKKVGELIKEQAKVALDTAKAAEKPDNKPTPNSANDQAKVADKTEAAKAEAAPLAPEAAKPLENAKKNMADAKGQLEKPDAAAAKPPQKEAMADLQAAKNAIEHKLGEVNAQLGETPPAPQLAKAAEAVAKAQEDVNQALNQLQQPAGIAEALKQAQKEIAAALEEKAKGAPENAAVNDAKQAAQEAAKKLDKNDLKGAIGEMAKAKQGIEKAAEAAEAKGEAAKPDAAKADAPKGDGKPEGQAEPAKGEAAGEAPKGESLPQLAKKQGDLKKMAELLDALQTQPAAEALQAAAEAIAPLTAGDNGQLPPKAQQNLQDALQALQDAAAQAEANKAAPAAANAETAQQALAQAAAALALAEAGVGNEAAQGQKGQGKGQAQAKGEGQGQQGEGDGKGQKPGKGEPKKGNGNVGNWQGDGGTDGPKSLTKGSSGFLSLPARERNAILQSQTERSPEEYGSAVEQYLKNLSDQSGGKK